MDFFGIAEQAGDLGYVVVTQFFAFAAETLSHLLPHRTGVDQLHFALAVSTNTSMQPRSTACPRVQFPTLKGARLAKKFNRVTKPQSDADHKRHSEIRKKVMPEFPPAKRSHAKLSGIGADFCKARTDQGMTWYAVAKVLELKLEVTPLG